MVAQLHDPYSQLLTGQTARQSEAPPPSVSSRISPLYGVGLQIFDPPDGLEDLVVLAPVPESPAEEAGILPLDRVTSIDGIDVRAARLTPSEALGLLRGREGTSVDVVIRAARNGVGYVRDVDDAFADRTPRLQASLSADNDECEMSTPSCPPACERGVSGDVPQMPNAMLQAGFSAALRLTRSASCAAWWRDMRGVDVLRVVRLTRGTLNIPPVRAGIIDADKQRLGKVGYVRVNTFNRKGTAMFEEALKTFAKQEVSGVIIDVRNCLGGQFAEALMTASMFVDPDDRLVDIMDASGIMRDKKARYQIDDIRWPKSEGRPGKLAPSGLPMVLLTNRGSASASEVPPFSSPSPITSSVVHE